jgi:hypothetical protein
MNNEKANYQYGADTKPRESNHSRAESITCDVGYQIRYMHNRPTE